MNEIARLMLKARTALVLSQPFFGTLALRLKMIEDNSIDSASVDGRTLRYNAQFVKDLTHAKRVGLIAHEVMHCAAGHTMRLGAREHGDFNIAADYAINPMILKAGLELPDGHLIDDQFDGLSAEEIYPRVRRMKAKPKDDDDQDQPGGDGDNIGGCGSFTKPADEQNPGKPATAHEVEQLANEWSAATLMAAALAKRAGQLPDAVEELIEDLKAPRVDWREALKRFVTTQAKQDYSWSPPNRRYIGSGLYLPSLRSEKIGSLVFAIDTSASMDIEALKQALAEVNAIAADLEPTEVHILECDTEVHAHTVFTPAEYPIGAKTMMGRGGTRFSPLFVYVEEHEIEPDCLIYFTDLDCYDFGPEPGYPVLWASTAGDEAPFGELIRVNAD
jgi:predicted metal-dependent peptidase